jgi:hypothetical protein
MTDTFPAAAERTPEHTPSSETDPEFVTTQAEEKIAVATQWQLMWWR